MTNKPELKPCEDAVEALARIIMKHAMKGIVTWLDCVNEAEQFLQKHTINRAELPAPSLDEVDTHINSLYNDALSSRDGYGNAHDDANAIRAHIATLEEGIEALSSANESFAKRIANLATENKRLREALAPFSEAAAKYRDIGKSQVADYIKQKTGLIAGYSTVFLKLCVDSTSQKNWCDAADALAQTDGSECE